MLLVPSVMNLLGAGNWWMPDWLRRHLPELHWVLGYPLALGMMAVSAIALYVGFRKRGWL